MASVSASSIDYVVLTHFHVDHTGYVGRGGLWHLAETLGAALKVGILLVP